MGFFRRQRVSLFRRAFLLMLLAAAVLQPGTPAFAQSTPAGFYSPTQATPQTTTYNPGNSYVQIGSNGIPTGNTIDANGIVTNQSGTPVLTVGQNKNAGINTGTGQRSNGADTQSTTMFDTFFNWIYDICVGLGGIIAGIGGAIFDTAMYYLVLHMGCWFTVNASCNATGITGIGALGAVVNTLWTVVRDIFNLLFIFALIYIGIRTILDADDSSAQKAIGLLIAAALLINFSLYITKAIVDVSDYMAVSVYAVAKSGITGTYGFGTANTAGTGTTYQSGFKGEESLSGAYMNEMKISSWFGGGVINRGINTVIFSFVVLIFALFLGLTLAYGGILLVVRFITLMILMIFSPAMFLGWILPNFKKHSQDWWDRFLKAAFFAPAYIFVLYLGLYALTQFKQSFNGSYASVFTASKFSPDTVTIFLLYVVGVGFLIAATRVGESMSKAGSAAIFGVASGARSRLLGAVGPGLLARAGRSTLGQASYRASQNNDLLDNAAEGGIGGFAARRRLSILRSLGDSSFDVRKVGGVGKKLGVGEGKKGGYATRLKESAKENQEYAKNLGDDNQAGKRAEAEYKNRITLAEDHVSKLNSDPELQALKQTMRAERQNLREAEDSEAKERSARIIEGINASIATREEELEITAAKKAVEDLKRASKEEISKAKNTRRKTYADFLRGGEDGEGSVLSWGKGGLQFRYQNLKDAEAVDKSMKKSKRDELLDTLEAADKNSKESS